MPNLFQFLEVDRANPVKVPAVSRVKEFNEIYTEYPRQDAADQADRVVRRLRPVWKATVVAVELPAGKDPADLSREGIWMLVNKTMEARMSRDKEVMST